MKARARLQPDAEPPLIAALNAVGTPEYLPRLIDLVGSLAAHDRITVTRYSVHARPEFLTHRNFSDALVQRYLAVYYPYDPFYAHWREHQAPGVLPLARFGSRELKQGRYIREFLRQSVIRDEVGVLLADGPGATLGIFLERAARSFARAEIAQLDAAFAQLAAIHALQRRIALPKDGPARPTRLSKPPRPASTLPGTLWPDLTGRERELVAMILAGHPPQAIAARLGISAGTVRNHRQNIFRKLDITTEREVFLQYLDFLAGA
jgi:DNA-binding CsgD family transcriptional regulator